ncbi:hypothetical protein [Streptomyces sp. NPDC059080]|uniref:hypothetical protein n=1 Tax=Streptomyces sp. NPDC059080 TaxID=3346718 RepID=UPI0036AE89D0
MDSLAEALLGGATPEELERLELMSEHLAAHLRAEDVGMFGDAEDKGVRKSPHVGPVPESAPDEIVVAVMAGSILRDIYAIFVNRREMTRDPFSGMSL